MKILKPLLKFLIILLVTLTLLEVMIRIGGMSFQYLAQKKISQSSTKIADGKTLKKVLILGDSTAVMGADKTNRYLEINNTYPKFLEQYLNSVQKKYFFKIENSSVMNGNTYKVLKNAEAQIDKFYPDIVVAMVGMIDGRQVPAIGKKLREEEKFNSRLYQLVQLYHEDKRQHEKAQQDQHSLPTGGAVILDSLRLLGAETNKNFIIPNFTEILRGHIQASYDLNETKFSRAAEKFESLYIKYGVGKVGLIKTLILSGNYSEAEKELMALVEKTDNPYFYGILISLYTKEKKFEKAAEIKKLIDGKKITNTLPVEIEWALSYKARGELEKSNEMLEAIRAKLSIEKMKKMNVIFAAKVIHNPALASDFYANLESNDLYSLIFEGLSKAGEYKKLDFVINHFTTHHTWLGITFYYLLENYILYGINDRSKSLLEHLSKEMRDVSDYYRLLVYHKFSNKSLDKKITERFKELFKNSVYNFEHLYSVTQDRKIPLILMQYPGFSVEVLKNFLNKPNVHYLSNEDLFKGVPLEQVIFEPKYPYVRNHYTEKGSQLIARRLGDYILHSLSL